MVRESGGIVADVLRRWPLVGREPELAMLADVRRQRTSAVIAGEPGVGKTRLVQTAVAAARADGWPTEWAVASVSASSIPFAALAGFLPMDVVGADREMLLQGMVASLRERRGREQLLIAVDDAHLLDDASSTLVGLLAVSETISVVITLRSNVAVPDAIAAIPKDHGNLRIDLQPLSAVEVATVLEHALDGRVDSSTIHMLSDRAAGNLLFLRDIVIGGLSSGALGRDHDLWRWRGPLDLPPSVVTAVASRLENLEADERRALELVALAEPAELFLLRPSVEDELLTGLERRGFLEVFGNAQNRLVQTGHPLYGEALRAGTPALQSATLYTELANALEAERERLTDDDMVRIARWRLASGASPDRSVVLRAAHRLSALADHVGAELMAQRALELGAGVEAGQLMAGALQLQGRIDEALQVFEALNGTTDEEIAAIAVSKSQLYAFYLGRPDEARTTLARAESDVIDDSSRHQLMVARALMVQAAGHLEETLEICAPLREPTVDSRARIPAVIVSMTSWTLGAQPLQAIAAGEAVAEEARHSLTEMPWAPSQLEGTRSLALYMSGQVHRMLDEGQAGYDRALAEGDEWAQAIFALGSGVGALQEGRVRTGAHRLLESVSLQRRHGSFYLQSALLYLACALAMCGDIDEAESALAEATQMTAGIPVLFESESRRVKACVLAAHGRTTAAQESALEGADIAEASGVWSFAAWALHDAARFGAASLAARRLRQIEPRAEGELIPLLARHAEALAAKDPEALDLISTDLENLGLILFAAEASAIAASLFLDRDRGAESSAALLRSVALSRRCEGAVSPALRRRHAAPLSEREMEVAALAAQGLGDREIANELCISVRTVHAHLRRVYEKLRIEGRKDLSRRLGTS